MVKRLSLVLLIVAFALPVGACRVAAPALESAGGYGGCGGECMTKTKMILRQWGRDARKNEEIIDTYLFNYDRNDPYRADRYVLDGENCCK